MQSLLESPAVVGGLAGAVIVALTNLVRGAFTLYRLRRGRTFEPRIELRLDAWIRRAPGTDVLHCEITIHNVGNVRVIVDFASLILRQRLIAEEGSGSTWAHELDWGDPLTFDALRSGVVPGLMLDPGERHVSAKPLGLSPASRGPIEATFTAASSDGVYWSTVAMVTSVAGIAAAGDNRGEEGRR